MGMSPEASSLQAFLQSCHQTRRLRWPSCNLVAQKGMNDSNFAVMPAEKADFA